MNERGYIILGYDPNTKIYTGYIENSFSMGFSTSRVKVYRADKYSSLQEVYNFAVITANTLNNDTTSSINFKVYRIGSKHCPVRIFWGEVVVMKTTNWWDKFKWRNLPFFPK